MTRSEATPPATGPAAAAPAPRAPARRRRRRLLPLLAGVFLISGAAQLGGLARLAAASAAAPAAAATAPGEGGLLAGCTDIPEAVDLAALLDARSDRMARYQAELERVRADIALAEGTLTSKLRQLKAAQDRLGGDRAAQGRAVLDDIDRLVGVYAAMKPKDAAAVLSNLPADFAAELLMRVDPETGAAMLAAVDPAQAAVLTSHMGARRVPRN